MPSDRVVVAGLLVRCGGHCYPSKGGPFLRTRIRRWPASKFISALPVPSSSSIKVRFSTDENHGLCTINHTPSSNRNHRVCSRVLRPPDGACLRNFKQEETASDLHNANVTRSVTIFKGKKGKLLIFWLHLCTTRRSHRTCTKNANCLLLQTFETVHPS